MEEHREWRSIEKDHRMIEIKDERMIEKTDQNVLPVIILLFTFTLTTLDTCGIIATSWEKKTHTAK